MDITLFRDLDRLRQTGNFSQAAVLVNLSQPAFSRRIKSLEKWVGAELVDRSRQPVVLTEAGQQMLEAGMQALTRIAQERAQIREALSLPDKYVVTFATQHSIGWRFFPAWLQALEEAHGPILSRLRADDLPNCLEDLRQGAVDFVIAYASAEVRPDTAQPGVRIGSDHLVPVCKPDGAGAPIYECLSGGVRMPFLRFGDAAPIGMHLEPLFAAQGLRARFRTVYENSMAGALRIRARAGDGVAWLPHSLVAPDLQSGVLVRTGPADWDIPLEILIFRDAGRSNRVTRGLWSFLEVRQAVSLLPG
jgi:DNA-binding transcriptional LysR family regulator